MIKKGYLFMRYMLVLSVLFTGLFAHPIFEEHSHFFGNYDMIDLLLISINLYAGFYAYKYFKKEIH